MGFRQKLVHEVKAVGFATLFFGCWIMALLLFKHLLLAEYEIEFSGWSKALVGVLILSKVVVVLEHVPLGAWVRRRPACVDVVLRTTLSALGVVVVLLLERAIDGRHEHGGFRASLAAAVEQADGRHVLVNTLVVSGALLGYYAFSVLRRHMGSGALFRMLSSPLPEPSEAK